MFHQWTEDEESRSETKPEDELKAATEDRNGADPPAKGNLNILYVLIQAKLVR